MIILTQPGSAFFSLETVIALRHRATPLHITVETTAPSRHTLQTPDRGEFPFHTHRACDDPIPYLEIAFRHYPDPVTLNGQPIERIPFPNNAAVRVVHSPHMDREETQTNPLGPGPPLPRAQRALHLRRRHPLQHPPAQTPPRTATSPNSKENTPTGNHAAWCSHPPSTSSKKRSSTA